MLTWGSIQFHFYSTFPLHIHIKAFQEMSSFGDLLLSYTWCQIWKESETSTWWNTSDTCKITELRRNIWEAGHFNSLSVFSLEEQLRWKRFLTLLLNSMRGVPVHVCFVQWDLHLMQDSAMFTVHCIWHEEKCAVGYLLFISGTLKWF